MKANELRIGNYVFNDENTHCKIVRIETPEYTDWNSGDEHNVIIEKNGVYYESKINPIELTVEWLLKLGFKRQPILEDDFALKKSLIRNWGGGEWLFKMNYWEAGKVIRYVHQLQNLYFALTGEELIINK